MKASQAIPLNHSRWDDPEFCCTREPNWRDNKHNWHLRPGAEHRIGALVSCCCKSVTSTIEPETSEP